MSRQAVTSSQVRALAEAWLDCGTLLKQAADAMDEQKLAEAELHWTMITGEQLFGRAEKATRRAAEDISKQVRAARRAEAAGGSGGTPPRGAGRTSDGQKKR